ncbi:MAG: hypothetical protein ACI9RM_002979 [Ulvibacter sp.]|jgi:hypothetical protein
MTKAYISKAIKNLSKSKDKKQAMPLIQYKGYSLNNKRIERVSLALDGRTKSYMLGKQESDLRLLEMHRDSVVVTWKEVRKVVYRK